jgi:hypothetical protein
MNATRKFATAAISALSIAATLAVSTSSAEAKFGRRGAFIAGLAGTIIGGAIIAGQARAAAEDGYRPAATYDGPGPGYRRVRESRCWTERQPRYNRWGDFRGFRYVQMCD